MRRRIARTKREFHREERRRSKGAKPWMVLPTDTIDENNQIVVGGALVEEKPKSKPKSKPKPKAKKKAPAKKAKTNAKDD